MFLCFWDSLVLLGVVPKAAHEDFMAAALQSGQSSIKHPTNYSPLLTA